MFRGKNYLTKNSEWIIEVNCDLYLDSLQKTDYENEEQVLENGYEYIDGDNSYNYESISEQTRELSYTMNWNLYGRKNPKWRGFQYVVEIRKHNWWDVRCNYQTLWYYKTNENCFTYLLRVMDAYKWCDMYQRMYLNDCMKNKQRSIEDFKKQK